MNILNIRRDQVINPLLKTYILLFSPRKFDIRAARERSHRNFNILIELQEALANPRREL